MKRTDFVISLEEASILSGVGRVSLLREIAAGKLSARSSEADAGLYWNDFQNRAEKNAVSVWPEVETYERADGRVVVCIRGKLLVHILRNTTQEEISPARYAEKILSRELDRDYLAHGHQRHFRAENLRFENGIGVSIMC